MQTFLKRLLLGCLLSLLSVPVYAIVKLPQLISDGMVLQRNSNIKVWGWAHEGEKVTVTFNGKTYHTVTNSVGKWFATLKPMKAGGPYTLLIKGTNQITIQDILIGDVWLCSGQSNMAVQMERVKEKYPDEITNANYPEIRNFFVPTIADLAGQRDDLPKSKWLITTPQNVLDFGAASYFFAKAIYQKYHIPIGIINSSVGGTPIEAWISEDGLKQFPNYIKTAQKYKDTAYVNQLNRLSYNASKNINKPTKQNDKGMSGSQPWYDPAYPASNWHTMMIPGYWADQGIRNLNGVVWYRKEISIPESMTAKPVKLFMGRIVDADEVYINGTFVGSTSYQYPPRRYTVPAGLLKAGKNTIVIRVINYDGKGGFVPDKPYFLTSGNDKIDLRGDWQYRVGQVFKPVYGLPQGVSVQNQPTALYNAMIAPLVNYNIKGVVWYQGEANTFKPEEYRQLLPALITNWRNKWQQPDMPFIYAQLPNFMEVQYLPSESQWAMLRDGQLKTLAVPNTGMAVSIDAGEWNDIHPLDKKDVGDRLALSAEKVAYHDDNIVYSGPIYQSAKIEDGKIMITFSNTGSGLVAKGDAELHYFAIAGADKKFVWASATIEGNKVVVWNADIPHPLYVRYAWADNPEGANLYNAEGLPASPFRTDE